MLGEKQECYLCALQPPRPPPVESNFIKFSISFLGGGIELGAYLLAFVVLNGFGRKYSLMVYLFLSGILCVAAVSVQHFVPGESRDGCWLGCRKDRAVVVVKWLIK